MKSYIIVVLAVALFAATVLAESGEEGDKKKGDCEGKKGHHGGWAKMMNVTCMGEPMKKEAMMMGWKDCAKEMKEKMGKGKKEGEEGREKREAEGDQGKKEGKGKGGKGKRGKGGHWGMLKQKLCMNVCQWKKQGILNADGDYDSAGVTAYAKSLGLSDKVSGAYNAAFATCASKIGDKATRMDSNCAGYKDFEECQLNEVFGKACGNEAVVKKMAEEKKKWQEKVEKWKKDKASKKEEKTEDEST